jgi:hypothetical protein
MESTPEPERPSNEPPRTKRLFHFFFWAPLVMTIGALVLVGAGDLEFGPRILEWNIWGMLWGAIFCSAAVGQRRGVGLGMLMFVGMLVLYGSGCVAVSPLRGM